MSYTQLNADVFTAAFSGATAGMGVSGRVITDGDQARYDGLISIANAFAEELDTLWGGTSIGFLELEIILEASQDIWSERAPVPSESTLDPNTWRTECEAIIALVNAALQFYADNSYTNPALGGGGTTVAPLVNVRYVDPDMIVTTPDGSIANPYRTVQAAFDDLFGLGADRMTIIITPGAGEGTGAGDLDINVNFSGNLNIRGENAAQNSLETPIESTSFGIGAIMGSITCNQDPPDPNLRVTIQNIVCDGIVATAGEEGTPNPVRFMFTDSQVYNINVPGGRVFGQRSTMKDITCIDFNLYEMQVNSGITTLVASNGGSCDMATLASLQAQNVNLVNVAGLTVVDAPQRLSNIFVVDPGNTGNTKDNINKTGAFSGSMTYPTLQAAYDASNTFPIVTSPVFYLCPGDSGALTMAADDVRNIIIRGFGSNELNPDTFIGAVALSNGAGNLTFIDMHVFSDVTNGVHGAFTGSLLFQRAGCVGAVNIPGASLNVTDEGIIGDITCSTFRATDFTQGPENLTATNRIVWDANSEFTYFRALNSSGSNIPNATELARTDDAAASAQIGPDSAFTIDGATNQRKVCQPHWLTAARIWKLDNSDNQNHGYVIDVWTQDFDLTIQDEADATLITIPAASDPVRLFFFAAGAANFTLINMQSLLQLS